MASVITPALNETQAPYQFDNYVLVSGADTRGIQSPMSNGQVTGQLVAQNFPTFLATGTAGATATAGSNMLAMLTLAANTTVNNIWINVITAASSLTSGQCFAGLYYVGPVSSLPAATTAALVGTTAQLATTVGTNTGFIKCPLTTPYTTASAGAYYVGCYFNGTSTPKMACYSGFVTATTSAGIVATFPNTSTSQYPFAVNGTSLTTTGMPTSLTITSNSTTNAFCYWAGVN
jgi:hypothetical protein